MPVAAVIRLVSFERLNSQYTVRGFAPSADVEDITSMVGLGRWSQANGLDFGCFNVKHNENEFSE
jgi:hypothetical protein